MLIAFLSFVADYGLMWVGRRQAQNAADAGALAGAMALAFDDFADRSDTGRRRIRRTQVRWQQLRGRRGAQGGHRHRRVFSRRRPCDVIRPSAMCDDTCIRVDVYRNQERGNPLPVWFGQLVGLVNQGVRATAIARASFGECDDCLKPWAVSIAGRALDHVDENLGPTMDDFRSRVLEERRSAFRHTTPELRPVRASVTTRTADWTPMTQAPASTRLRSGEVCPDTPSTTAADLAQAAMQATGTSARAGS